MSSSNTFAQDNDATIESVKLRTENDMIQWTPLNWTSIGSYDFRVTQNVVLADVGITMKLNQTAFRALPINVNELQRKRNAD